MTAADIGGLIVLGMFAAVILTFCAVILIAVWKS